MLCALCLVPRLRLQRRPLSLFSCSFFGLLLFSLVSLCLCLSFMTRRRSQIVSYLALVLARPGERRVTVERVRLRCLPT